MDRLLLSFVLVICTTLIGNWFAVRLSTRTASLCRILESIRKIKMYISFGGYDVERVVSLGFEGATGFESFSDFSVADSTFCNMWNNCVDKIPSSTALSNDDRVLLKRFSEGLGVSDLDGQMANCELYIEIFSEKLKESKESENKKSRLYRVLGFSAGSAIALLLL